MAYETRDHDAATTDLYAEIERVIVGALVPMLLKKGLVFDVSLFDPNNQYSRRAYRTTVQIATPHADQPSLKIDVRVNLDDVRVEVPDPVEEPVAAEI